MTDNSKKENIKVAVTKHNGLIVGGILLVGVTGLLGGGYLFSQKNDPNNDPMIEQAKEVDRYLSQQEKERKAQKAKDEEEINKIYENLGLSRDDLKREGEKR